MQEHLEPSTSDYEGLSVSERGPWYKQLWDSLSRLDGCKFGIGAILVALAIPGNSPTVKAIAVVVVGALAIVDELRKSKSYAETQDKFQTQETEP